MYSVPSSRSFLCFFCVCVYSLQKKKKKTSVLSLAPMRIRKRQVPLSLSSLSPIPISDPQLNGSPVVQLHHPHDPNHNLSQQADTSSSQPSDHPNQSIRSGSSLDQKDKDCLVLLEEDEEKINDSRKNSILGAEIAAAGVLSQLSSSPHQVVGRWCEGEKAFPLKKRRRDSDEYNKKTKAEINKKFDDNYEQEEQSDQTKGSVDSNYSTSTSSKKRARARARGGGGAIMEGSRCSRVNGRGWRCCQQTLVGYSLCEHHLGKGRLRSMNNVRSRSLGSSTKLALSSSSSSTLRESKMNQEVALREADEDDQKPLVIAKKRMKLGMVKARSISSLLGQKDNEIIAADR